MSVASADALQDWLARVTGGRVLTWEAVTSGNSRSTFAADVEVGGERLALVVRHDEGGGPVAGTALSLEREAAVYRALEGSGLPVPRLYAATPTLGAMAVERLSGAAHESGAVLRELLVQLAALHNLQVERLAPPGFARTAAAELELWQGIARQKLADPDELVELAFAILRDRFPGEPERYVLCHGDFLNANHDYEHKNRSFRGFGSYGDLLVRDRKMYVAPTPFALAEGTAGKATLITPDDLSADERLEQVGELTRTETEQLVIGYTFDFLGNTLVAKHAPNPSAGKEHHFFAYRVAGAASGEATMKSAEVVKQELEDDDA